MCKALSQGERVFWLQEGFVEGSISSRRSGNWLAVEEVLQSLLRSKEALDQGLNRLITNGGVINCGFVIMRAGTQRTFKRSLLIEAIHNGHDRRIGKIPGRANRFLNTADGDGRAVPDGFHDVQFKRSQHYWEPLISIISRAASFPGAWEGIERMRK